MLFIVHFCSVMEQLSAMQCEQREIPQLRFEFDR